MTSGMDVVNLAKQSLGVNYVWGGNDLQSGVDCSGLVQQVYAKLGIQLPRTTYNQINSGSAVQMADLQPGDLVFFATESASDPDHVGIYAGGGKFIQAPHTGDVVKISDLSNSYYTNRFVGGRRIAGVTGGTNGSSTADSPAPAPPVAPSARMDGQELAQEYGLSYAFFQSEPELMGLLNQAVDGQWDPNRWTAALKSTDWWKTNSDTQRKLKDQQAGDPASYNAQLAATTEQLRLQAVQMGAVMSDRQLQDAAKLSLASGWGNEQVQSYLGNYIDFIDKNVMGGLAQSHYLAIKDTARKNGLALDDDTAKTYAAYIGRGLSTLDQTLAQVRQQAAGAFPAFADQILAGQDVATIASPYAQMMAREMGRPQTQIDPLTPEIKNALNRRGTDGNPSPMTLSDFQQSLRSDPAWRQTQTAQDAAMQAGSAVLKMMGLTS